MSSPTTLPPDSIAITPDGLDPSRVGPARSVKMRQVNAERPTGISRSHVELKASKIMIVDDEEINIRVVQRHLEQAGYRNFVTVAESKCAVDKACLERPDIVLLDVMMPEVDGLQVLHRLRALDETRHVPVVILTASADASTKLEALDIGANEFLTKPVDRVELVLRVRNALMVKVHGDQLANYSEQLEREVRLRTAELEDSRQEVIDCLARAAEYRDGDTGHHVVRVGRYVGIIAREMGFDDEYIDLLEQAAKLHDVGKIGIPDAILLKPGKLTKEEFDYMKRHCAFGTEIIQKLPEHPVTKTQALKSPQEVIQSILERDESPLLTLAALIAQTHHEKWDGSGYPLGLKGDAIPIEGRITAVADVFDALSSARPYKQAFPLKKCLEILLEGRGKHFDPAVLDAFLRRIKEVAQVYHALGD